MSDLALLHAVIAHARANGWTHDTTCVTGLPRDHRWRRDGAEVNWFNAYIYVNYTKFRPASVRQAVDLLVDLDVLPVEFHSAYAEAQRAERQGIAAWIRRHADETYTPWSKAHGALMYAADGVERDPAATEEPDRTLTAPERRAESDYIAPFGVVEETRIAQALDHIAAGRPVVWPAAGADDPNDEITDTEWVSDAIDAKAAEAGAE